MIILSKNMPEYVTHTCHTTGVAEVEINNVHEIKYSFADSELQLASRGLECFLPDILRTEK